MVFVGSWIWALLAATRASRAGMIVALIFSLLMAFGGGLLTILVLCPTPCGTAWPVGNIIVWVALIAGLGASLALGQQYFVARR